MIADILSGKYDGSLDDVIKAVQLRRKQVSEANFFNFKIGDKVRFNDRTRPGYLVGQEAIIKEKKLKKVVVDIINPPVGSRFTRGVRTDVSLIEKV